MGKKYAFKLTFKAMNNMKVRWQHFDDDVDDDDDVDYDDNDDDDNEIKCIFCL